MDKPVIVKPLKKSNKSWIAYVVIALILSLWSAVGAAFFLLVTWVILQNPKDDLTSAVGKQEKSTASRVYTWLFFSSFITVPFLIIIIASSYSGNSSTNEQVLQALFPLIFHLPLLLGLTSRSRFVYRHTQQGILLIALRASIAAIALTIGDYPEDGLWLFLLGNGLLWFFGSIWGWVQVNRGDCWWMKQKGDLIAVKDESVVPKIDAHATLSPEKYLEYSKWYLKREQRHSAKEYALEAFRQGNFEVRRQAIRVLDDLNEVEFF